MKTCILKSVAEELEQEEERACVDNINLQNMKDRSVRRGEGRAGWLTGGFQGCLNQQLTGGYRNIAEHEWVCPEL